MLRTTKASYITKFGSESSLWEKIGILKVYRRQMQSDDNTRDHPLGQVIYKGTI